MARILVVEDKDDHRRILCDVLRWDGHEVVEASNGKEALEKLQQEENIDLVTLDDKMPVMTGLECLEEIRNDKATANIPVLFVTVYRKPEIEDLRRQGVTVVHKPYDYREFLRAVKTTLGKHGHMAS
jgi:CheY-like chemotaxis protein